ncbi:LuxR C-terminal-related transcriptional regulator [Rhizobium sp. SGZ-381]|uniref:LuxR C-terminal-related transcriptional regulator n=1 Tax=Rhizobium sp. SGZ-381 TaxID=3342800 RepID=UPI00366CC4F8
MKDQNRYAPPISGQRPIKRRGLLLGLHRSGLRRLTTIIGSAGYGKTSLAAQWHEMLVADEVRCLWISLEQEHCDQRQFLLTLLDALQPLLADDTGGLDAASMPVASLLSILATRLRRIEQPLVLFLDDYHLAQTDATEALMAKILADRGLDHLKLVLISRSPPRFPLSALRLHGELKQIGVADLGFSDDEALEFFSDDRLGLNPEQIGALNRRTEGWAVALQMVRLLVHDNPQREAVLASFDGSNVEMGNYLSEQVFAQLPDDIQQFLLKTAALPAFSRDLVAALFEGEASALLMDRLADHALPITLLAGEGGWMRSHPVFNAFLRQKALRQGFDTQSAVRRAARWFEVQGDFDQAVRHALSGGSADLAARIVERAGGWRRVYATTRGGTMLFQMISARAAGIDLDGFPLTTLGLSVVSAKAGQLEAANHYLSIAERAVGTLKAYAADLRVVKVLLSLYLDHWATSADLAALEDDLLKPEGMELIHRALALNMLSYNYLIRSDLERARHYGHLAIRTFRDGGADFGAMHLYTHIGQAAFFSGDAAGAEEAYDHLISEAQANIGPGSDLDAVGQVLKAELQSMRGDLSAAAAPLSWALPHLERHDTWFDLLAAGVMGQQRVLRLGGDVVGAHASIDRVRSTAKRRGFDRLIRLIDGECCGLLISTGDIEHAIRHAELSGFGRSVIQSDRLNTLQTHLRGTTPALLWTRIFLAEGKPERARDTLDWLMTRQSERPHLVRSIELQLLEIRILAAEGRKDAASACLCDLLMTMPLADYASLLQLEAADVPDLLRELSTCSQFPAVARQRLLQCLDRVRPADPAHVPPFAEMVAPGADLTERERSVLSLLSAGLSNKEIGRRLDLSDNTIKFHLRNIFTKLNVSTRTAAVTTARDKGVLQR